MPIGSSRRFPSEVADDLGALERDRSAELVALLLDLRAEIGVVRQQRLGLAVTLVPLGEERGGAVEVLVGKRPDLDPGHET